MESSGPTDEAVERIQALLRQGAPWSASDAFRAAERVRADDPDLLYWGALAAARSGAGHRARELLERARAVRDIPPALLHEILCLGGRLWKDRVDPSVERLDDRDALEHARTEYRAAYAIGRDSYSGVNAATLSMLLDDRGEAVALAGEISERLTAATAPLTIWEHAALGECALLLGQADVARQHYANAWRLTSSEPGNVASMRRQIRLLRKVLPAAEAVLEVLPPATVVAFSGHLIDRHDQSPPRFPASLEPPVATALRAKLATYVSPVVYTSAACGADLLFIEAALDCGAEVNVVLPFDREDFVRTSVATGGTRWTERFDRALARVQRVVLATEESYLGDDVLFEHALHLVEGLALLRASQLQTEAVLLCVLDLASPALSGGTRSAYDRWVRTHGAPEVIDLRSLREQAPAQIDAPAVAAVPPAAAAFDAARPQRTLKFMLFADIAGYGRLHDAVAPLFHMRFLQVVADQIAQCAVPPLESNTWGDALYVVFGSAVDGAEFALGLLDRMQSVDWIAAGLSETSRIRIALHAGPVFCGFDPIMGRDNYFGSSVTKTARIEPVTPPGLIYASEAFVATLTSLGHGHYGFEYMGNLELAKGHGESRIYRLERRR